MPRSRTSLWRSSGLLKLGDVVGHFGAPAAYRWPNVALGYTAQCFFALLLATFKFVIYGRVCVDEY